jgi:hypothetical protein
MKLSHGKLELARVNLAAVIRSLVPGAEPKRSGMYTYWQYAVHSYHNHGQDRRLAARHFETLCARNLKDNSRNQRRIATHKEYLDQYFDEFESSDHHLVDSRARVSIEVSPDLTVTGIVPRIDLSGSSGYAACLFAKETLPWKDELRFPLLQHHLSDLFGVKVEDVKVGIYCLTGGGHEFVSYSNEEINACIAEVAKIGKALVREMKR